MRKELARIIFGTDTPMGKAFDVALLWAIMLSVLAVTVESIPALGPGLKALLLGIEWFFTIIFTLEYILRILVSDKKLRYVFSFWGLVDLLAILPAYLSLIVAGTHILSVVRVLRLLRIFRILRLVRFISEGQRLAASIRSSAHKISIFMSFVLALVFILGSLMYVVEQNNPGFSSIPQSIYWAIVTITTVGFGDVVPQSQMGKFIAAVVMLLGYSIIAVPSGIVTVEMNRQKSISKPDGPISCRVCSKENPATAKYCMHCGTQQN